MRKPFPLSTPTHKVLNPLNKLLFLDTEYCSTTHELAQLSYILMHNGTIACKNFYFQVSAMDEGSFRVNGLSFDWLQTHGIPCSSVRDEILADFSSATLIAHNLNADKRVLEQAFGPLPNAFGLCTMYRFAKVLKLPGGRPYKMPSLRELMAHYAVTEDEITALTQSEFSCTTAHHDARWDAEAVRLCTLRAMRNGDCRNLLPDSPQQM